MTRLALFAVVAAFLLALFFYKDTEERRVALVLSVTGSEYHSANGSFDTPTPDVALTLSKLGFEVIESIEPDRLTVLQRMREFADAIKEADVGLIYYSGKVLQLSGRNYFVPAGIKEKSLALLEYYGVPFDDLLHEMEKVIPNSYVFLNACGVSSTKKRPKYLRGLKTNCPGLKPIANGKKIVVAHANQSEGNIFTHRKSERMFADTLRNNLMATNTSIADVMQTVRKDISKLTQARQLPWVENGEHKKFVFNERYIHFDHQKPKAIKIASIVPQKVKESNKTNLTPEESKTQKTVKVIAHKSVKQNILGDDKRLVIPSEDILSEDKPVTTPKITKKQVRKMDRNTAVRVLQKRLSEFSCYRGRVDGIWGPLSRRAAKQFSKNVKRTDLDRKPSVDLYKAVAEFSGPVCGRVCKNGLRKNKKGQCTKIVQAEVPFIPVIIDSETQPKKFTRLKPKKKVYKRKYTRKTLSKRRKIYRKRKYRKLRRSKYRPNKYRLKKRVKVSKKKTRTSFNWTHIEN